MNNALLEKATFIVGHPRSGTTLLMTLFNSHPDLAVLPCESHFFDWAYKKDVVAASLERTSFLTHFTACSSVSQDVIEEKMGSLLEASSTKKQLFQNLVHAYIEIDEGRSYAHAKRWVEKTPDHLCWLPVLKKWFGQSMKVIYLYRDPRDVYVSVKKKHASVSPQMFCESYMTYTALWNWYKQHSDWFFSVRYEDLASHSRETMEKLAHFLDIEFRDTLLQPTLDGKPFGGISRFNEMYAVSPESIGRHKTYAVQEEIRYIEEQLAIIMDQYGYECLDRNRGKCNLLLKCKAYMHVFHYFLRRFVY